MRDWIDMRPALCTILFAASALAAPQTLAARTVDFERDIQPIFRKSCVKCHGAEKQKADLRLDLKIHALKGGENGVVIVPGDSAKSPLLQRVTSEDNDER